MTSKGIFSQVGVGQPAGRGGKRGREWREGMGD